MDDIGNLVYILVFVVWLLSRIFGKGRKKVPPKSTTDQPGSADQGYPGEGRPTETTAPPVTFEDILRELTGAPSEPAPAREPEPVAEEEAPETYYTEDIPYSEEETAFEILEADPPAQVPKPANISGRFKAFEAKKPRSAKATRQAVKMLRSKQGARQAFIMKEIFERKY
ncbi:MAG: hypothetical protein DHS20C17_26560 [Cyclobacteriaceae bacterium]|nr:MAG: hypothetical protein DHS20C17_26560 [Cyclobacteriaceae bacterium]